MKQDDVRRFHDELGHAYLAYAYPDHPRVYPTGARRLDAVLALVEEWRGARVLRNAVDLGCGRGDLCVRLGAVTQRVIGIDFSTTMIAEAEQAATSLPEQLRERVVFRHSDCFDNRLLDESFDLVTAIGVLETEADDARLLNEARRLLRTGGALVVSSRNRLFNLISVNAYMRDEIASGTAEALLHEIETLLARTSAETLSAAASGFAAACMDGARAADSPAAEHPRGDAPAAVRFGSTRQHTPLLLEAAAAACGFRDPVHIGVHPHPLPPGLEAIAPESYNGLARAAEAFARLPLGLVWSSAFVTRLTKA